MPAEKLGLIWIDVEGHEPQVLRGLGALVAPRSASRFEYAPQRYGDEARRELVGLLGAHYSTLHSLARGSGSPRADRARSKAWQNMDDILVF